MSALGDKTDIPRGDDIAGGDMLIVGDGDRGDVAGDFRRERGLPSRDEGIVCTLEMPGLIHNFSARFIVARNSPQRSAAYFNRENPLVW
jgi:hypothetical protein